MTQRALIFFYLFPPQGASSARLRMSNKLTTLPIGQQVSLPGHFPMPVALEGTRRQTIQSIRRES